MLHVPGTKHRAADALSRCPVGEPEELILMDDLPPDPLVTMLSNPNQFPASPQAQYHVQHWTGLELKPPVTATLIS